MKGTLHEDIYTSMIFRLIVSRMIIFSDKSCRGKSKHTFCIQ